MDDAEPTEWMENTVEYVEDLGKLLLAMDELAKDYERMGWAQRVREIQEIRPAIDRWASTGHVDPDEHDHSEWIEVLQYIAGCPGHLEDLKLCIKLGYRADDEDPHCNALCTAAESGDVEMLAYLAENGWESHYVSKYAALGSMDCLRYAIEELVCEDYHTCEAAASIGDLDCLRYAHEHGCRLNGACEAAASIGDLDCLRYAHEHGCKLTQDAFYEAIYANSFDCVKYLFSQRGYTGYGIGYRQLSFDTNKRHNKHWNGDTLRILRCLYKPSWRKWPAPYYRSTEKKASFTCTSEAWAHYSHKKKLAFTRTSDALTRFIVDLVIAHQRDKVVPVRLLIASTKELIDSDDWKDKKNWTFSIFCPECDFYNVLLDVIEHVMK
jgi:hypothetical protein